MQLALYFANVAELMNIEEAIRFLDVRQVPSMFTSAVFWDGTSSREYLGNLFGLGCLEKRELGIGDADRLYFGQEFCQYLIPEVADLEKAYYFARQLDWAFTYVTGYLTDAGVDKVRRNLEFLAQQDDEIEVVVNDWGVLSTLARDFPALHPVLGRLLVKQPRLGRFASSATPPPVSMDRLTVPETTVRENQLSALQGLSLSNEAYRQELKRLGVGRVDLDIVPQGVSIHPRDWQLEFSCYFPWGYLAGGRNCPTAGTIDPRRRYVVADSPCPRPCRKVNRTPTAHFAEAVIQRGNSVFLLHSEYAMRYLSGEIPVSRIVFQPYIPI